MKIERIRSFTPVVITLETEEELTALRMWLGQSSVACLKEAGAKEPVSTTDILYSIYDQLCSF